MSSYSFKVGDRVKYKDSSATGTRNFSKGWAGRKAIVVETPRGGMTRIQFDDGNTGLPDTRNLELLVEAGADRYIKVGSRVTYRGTLDGLNEKTGKVDRFYGKQAAIILFDHEPRRERVIYLNNLFTIPAGESTMSSSFKTAVGTAIRALLAPISTESAKEQAVRRLGVASEVVKLGEADKKKAKTELTTLGIITGGEQTGVVFDSARYVMTATTKAASSRLDQDALVKAMSDEGISTTKLRRILVAATVTNKAATSFTVEAK